VLVGDVESGTVVVVGLEAAVDVVVLAPLIGVIVAVGAVVVGTVVVVVVVATVGGVVVGVGRISPFGPT